VGSWGEVSGRRLPLGLSIAALVVAVLGSTPIGEAAKGLVIPANSVGTGQLKNGSVTSKKVKNGSLVAADFKRGQLARGETGPAGPPGPQGPEGDKGAPATALWGIVRSVALQKGSGISGVMLTGAGTYRVSFAQDVSQCAVIATPVSNSTTLSAGVSSANKQDVIVVAFDSKNNLSDFSIAAFC
jgi:hypothetical protein